MEKSQQRLFDNLISKEELAIELGVNPRTIGNWISMGKLPAIKVGRQRRLLRSSVEKWLIEQEQLRKPRKRRSKKHGS